MSKVILSRRARAGSALVAAFTLFAAGCGGDGDASPAGSGGETASAQVLEITPELIKAAQAEGQLFLRYSAQQSATEHIAKEFEKKYGIKVTIDQKIRAEGTQLFASEERAGKHVVDVHHNSDRPGYLSLIKEGLYAKFTLPGLEQNFPAGAIVKDYGVGPYPSEMVFAYNADRLSTPDAERLFADGYQGLLDPQFANRRIGIVDPNYSAGVAVWFWGVKEDQAYGAEFLNKLAAQKLVVAPTLADGEELLGAGEISVLVGEYLDQAELKWNAGAPERWLYLKPSPSLVTVVHFISANAPHPNAARLFTAWLLGRDGAVAMAGAGRVPSLKGEVPATPIQQKLRAESWWKPYPAEVRFAPDFAEQDEKLPGYQKETAELFGAPTS